jgi:hypothetical protein
MSGGSTWEATANRCHQGGPSTMAVSFLKTIPLVRIFSEGLKPRGDS